MAGWSGSASTTLEIPAGTRIPCRLEQTVSPSDAGRVVQLLVTEDIEINGAVLIPRGSPVSGMAIQIMGRLDISIDSVIAADGERIPLRYSQAGGGSKDSGAVKAGATIIFWPAAPFILLRQGGNITIPRGVVFEMFTAHNHAIGPV